MQSAIAYHLTTCPQFVTFTGRNADWTDTHIPRTERPVRFYPKGSLGMWLPRLHSRISL